MPESRKPKAWSYERFSDPAKRKKGRSIERQNVNRDRWLARHPEVGFDESLVYVDEGISGFTGEHRTNPVHQMHQLLERVEDGTVRPGDFLIVENLDRLTREHPLHSIPWVCGLITRGIRIVQLVPWEAVYHSGMDESTLMGMLQELTRAHGESKRKVSLSGGNWALKKRDARSGVPHGKSVPAWLELREGRYVLRPGAKDSIRHVFRLHSEGMGYQVLARHLNLKPVPSWVPGGRWTRGYLAKLLTSRCVLGEYQPMKGHKPRVPDGDPVPGYFPVVLDLDEFNRARGARAARAGRTGRPGGGRRPTTPFSGLLWSAADGSKLRLKAKPTGNVFITARQHEGVAEGPLVTFPVNALVDGLLSSLEELQTADLFSRGDGGKLESLRGQLVEVEGRLALALERFKGNRASSVWADQVDQHEQEAEGIRQEIQVAEQEASGPLCAAWTKVLQLAREKDPMRLRQALLTTVRGIWCLFVRKGFDRLAAVQVYFAGGAMRRTYFILAKVQRAGGGKDHKVCWFAHSAPEKVNAGVDLRERPQAALLAATLLKRDWTEFMKP